jgi:hypothetical protein
MTDANSWKYQNSARRARPENSAYLDSAERIASVKVTFFSVVA